ncbi:glycosyltransferase family 2 protein [Altericista sp. CCNU0014]|uniref:glycosyltransferase family 2 protein n=1 Tax=Altericista sp. CCNU0014 TaxID=3082949 RepID=UPI00384AFB4A
MSELSLSASGEENVSPAPLLSIIVPVYNGGEAWLACLKAIAQFKDPSWEWIVVDDGSTDRSAIVAANAGATIFSTEGRRGPGVARNLGAQFATGEYLCFLDADCEIHPQTLAQLVGVLEQHPETDAVFGSYDDAPKAPNFVAQYKNLLHHYTHQTGCEVASTFWAGCGAVKRSTFLALRGFDEVRYPRPSIEDIELGYRLRQAGGSIYLAKQVQVKHHKAWSFKGLLQTDVCDRAIPWTRLLLSYPSGLVDDLNLQLSSRLSAISVYLLLLFLLASFYRFEAIAGALLVAALLLYLNRSVYRFFLQKRGAIFAIKAVGMHWLYYLYSGFALFIGTSLYWGERLKQKIAQ